MGSLIAVDVGDDDRVGTLHHRDAGVRRPQIDADDLALCHVESLRDLIFL